MLAACGDVSTTTEDSPATAPETRTEISPDLPNADLSDLAVCTIEVSHDCGQLSPPEVEWPRLTEIRDTDCNLKIGVQEDGSVIVIEASCTDERLVPTVVNAASTIRYKARDVCGNACPEVGREFDYPIQFRLEE